MLRIKIEVLLEVGESKTVSFMLKLSHQTDHLEKINKKLNMFDIERNAYNTIIPELEELYRNDLQPKGFKNTNRLEGLDQLHTEKVLCKLAQWHAASAVRVLTKGTYKENMTSGYLKEENRELMVAMGKEFSKNFVECCAKYDGNEAYIEDVKALQPKLIDEMYHNAKIDKEEFNVLNHGDCWSNNIMFKYDSFDKIKEVYFVDFQLPRYGSVAQDLYCLLLSSTKLKDKLNEFDQYIKYYHDQLKEHLIVLKYSEKIPTLRDIHLSLLKHGTWGFNAATAVMRVVLLDRSESSNLKISPNDSDEIFSYSHARYRKHIQKILPWLQNRGALETNQFI